MLWVQVPIKMVSIGRKLNTVGGTKNKIVYFDKEIKGTKVTNPKPALNKSLGEDVGFRDDNFVYGIQQFIPNDQDYDNLSGNKD